MKSRISIKVLVIIALSVMFGLSSCTKYAFMPIEEKIVGIWDFENVMYSPGYLKSRENITWQYQSFQYIFESNGGFIMRMIETGDEYRGKWTLTELTTGYEQPETYYTLHFSVYNPDTNDIEQYVWDIESITEKKLYAREIWGDEEWTYRMVRM